MSIDLTFGKMEVIGDFDNVGHQQHYCLIFTFIVSICILSAHLTLLPHFKFSKVENKCYLFFTLRSSWHMIDTNKYVLDKCVDEW